MKKIYIFLAAALIFSGCSEWLEPQSINQTDYSGTVKTDEYYASLREWKETPGLPQVFVWFDSWSGTSPSGANSLRGLPDSVTIASNWGRSGGETNKFDLSDAQKADMEYVQRVKGTKVVFTFFSRHVGEGMPRDKYPHYYNEAGEYNYKETIGNSTDEEFVRPYIRQYAEDIYHACIEAGYDGYDWDYEPGFGMGAGANAPFWDNEVQSRIFVEEMSYWFGREAMDPNRDRGGRPMPEKRLLFLIDGAVGVSSAGVGGSHDMYDSWPSYCFDYYILQAYGGNRLSQRVAGVVQDVMPWINQAKLTPEEVVSRTILTENFESYASTGGRFLDMSKFIYQGNLAGVSVDQQIGGCGLYRVGFDYNQGKGDYNGSPEYYFLRQGITNLYKIYYERNQ